MATPPAPFPLATIESVARAVGDLYTGPELTNLLAEAGLRDDPGPGLTKWRRIAHAAANQQATRQNGQPVVNLVAAAMSPHRTLSRVPQAAAVRDELNQHLSLMGLRVRDDGKVARTDPTSTDVEAAARTTRLRTLLTQRSAHAEVLTYCRPELVRSDYYEAVFEAIKGLGSRLRQMTGEDLDGPKLVETVMEGRSPRLLINPGHTETQRNEQRGVALLAKGLFAAFRNPAAHEPRLHWTMSEHDALDVLGTLSLVHRRLDSAAAHAYS